MRKVLALFIVILASGRAQAWVAVSTPEGLSIKRPGGSKLSYYFSAPDKKPFPLLLYLGGSGCQSEEGFMEYFAPFVGLGFGVVMSEKRGVKKDDSGKVCSKTYLKTNDRQQRIADAKLLLSQGKDLFPDWNGKLVVVGASEGGGLAPEVGLSYKGTKAVISLAGGGWPQGQESKKLREKELVVSGASPEKIQDELADLDRQFEEIRLDPTGSKSWSGKGNTYKRWASYLWYSPLDFLEKLRVPVYVAQGTTDVSVPVESSDAIRDRFKELGKKNLTYRRYKGLDHGWADAKGEHQTQKVIGDLLEWLRPFAE
ncbi:MAG: hypothetical protein AAB320_03285 [Elusimicrobiota bacterium]